MSAKASQIDSLTPLRGIAALWVVVFHLDGMSQSLHLGTLFPNSGIVSRGYLWVDFFFVLSGFIITHVYGARFTAGFSRRDFGEFLVARFSRLYPLHFVALCVMILLNYTLFKHFPVLQENGLDGMLDPGEVRELPYHFCWLLGIGLIGAGWNFPAWSIATEWWTYLITLPLFRLLNRGVSARTYGVILLCVGLLFALISRHNPRSLDMTTDFGLLRCLLGFVLGICCYQFYRSGGGQPLAGRDVSLVLVVVLVALLLHFPNPPYTGAAWETGFPVPIPHPFTLYLDALIPLAFMALILCAAHNRARGQRLLNTKPLRYLGEISFSLYLMQMNTMTLFFVMVGYWRESHPEGEMGIALRLVLFAITLGFTILCSMGTYHGVEKPARARLRRILIREAS